MKNEKVLEFLYQENEIHFLVNPLDKDVMVNATEVAKLFNRRTKDFLKTDHAKAFIEVAERALNGAHSGSKLIDNRGHMGIYFNKRLALKFAAWLSPEFEYWVYSTIDEIVFGNYKKHWEAHARQEEAKEKLERTKNNLFENPTKENVALYFEAEKEIKEAKKDKTKAIRSQLSLFERSE